jgi:hypothetical protein
VDNNKLIIAVILLQNGRQMPKIFAGGNNHILYDFSGVLYPILTI